MSHPAVTESLQFTADEVKAEARTTAEILARFLDELATEERAGRQADLQWSAGYHAGWDDALTFAANVVRRRFEIKR